jgi:nitroimidazol reductase NimA-like FMN-containing flavoprotein (pyridoxamine 5'-phosphate oxidase superfamily)
MPHHHLSGRLSERLTQTPIAWFTSVGPDHAPHTVPVWFVHNEADVWVASSPTSRKVANVRSNDQVSMAIDGSDPRPLVALARAEVLDDPAEHPGVAADYARKYRGFDVTTQSLSAPLVLMRLSITRWLLDGSTP